MAPRAIFAAEVSSFAFQARRKVRMQQVTIRIVCVIVTSGTRGAAVLPLSTKLALTANVAILLAPLVLVLPGGTSRTGPLAMVVGCVRVVFVVKGCCGTKSAVFVTFVGVLAFPTYRTAVG